jgi:outer membrane murein-binding lipoprotein Lpp
MKRIHRILFFTLLVSLTLISGCSRTSKMENARTFADEAFKDLAHDWSEKTLKKYAGPEFYAQCDEKKAAQICKLLGEKLGPLTSYKGAKPQNPNATTNTTAPLILAFIAEADFRNGPGTALLMVQEKEGGRWSLNGFQIKSPVLMQQNPNPPVAAPKAAPKPATSPSTSPTP